MDLTGDEVREVTLSSFDEAHASARRLSPAFLEEYRATLRIHYNLPRVESQRDYAVVSGQATVTIED